MKEKKCRKCGRVLPLVEFSRDEKNKDGHVSQCKQCIAEYSRKYREANKDKIAEKDRKWKKANKEKVTKYDRKYREANKEKIAEKNRKWKKANKEYNRKYKEANKEKIAEYQRGRYANDPEFRAMCEVRQLTKRIEKGNKRSLEIYGVPSREWTTKIRRGRIRIYDKYFKGVKKHLDHVRPLGEVKHSVEEMHKRSHFTNLLYIPAEANLSKGATPFWEWFAELKDEKLKKCIAEQDAYNKKIQRKLNANP